MSKLRRGQRCARLFQYPKGESCIALFRNQLRAGVRGQFIREKEISRNENFPQQVDAFANQRCDLQHLFGCCFKPGGLHERKQLRRQFFHRQMPQVFRIEPQCLRIEGILFSEVDHRVAAINAFE